LLNLFPDVRQITLRALWLALESRFVKEVHPEVAKQELNAYRLSFANLAIKIERLVRLAYPKANLEIFEELALENFVRSIANSHIRYQLRLYAPIDIQTTKIEAERIFHAMSAESGLRNAIMCGRNDLNQNTEVKFIKTKNDNKASKFSHQVAQQTNERGLKDNYSQRVDVKSELKRNVESNNGHHIPKTNDDPNFSQKVRFVHEPVRNDHPVNDS
jgi:hypothetical protein